MPQIDDYPYTYTAGSVAEFISKLNRAAEIETDPAVIREFLGQNRWEDRADRFLEEINRVNKNSLALSQILIH
jgi:hypothetical protein